MLRHGLPRLALIVLALLGSIGINIQPASAAVVSPWLMGYPMRYTTNLAFPGSCTSGPMLRITSNNVGIPAGFYMILAKHCVTPTQLPNRFYWNNPSSNLFEMTDVYPATGADIALARIAPLTNTIAPNNTSVVDYCNSGAFGFGNCSSFFEQPYSSNTGFRTVLRAGYGGISHGSYVCKSGIRSGVTCGTVSYDFSDPNGPYQRWKINNLTSCGTAPSDSGGPVYQVDSNGRPWLVGVHVARELATGFISGPNNGCYDQGLPIGSVALFHPILTIVNTFYGLSWGVNTFGV